MLLQTKQEITYSHLQVSFIMCTWKCFNYQAFKLYGYAFNGFFTWQTQLQLVEEDEKEKKNKKK